jgi:hypothetical protein
MNIDNIKGTLGCIFCASALTGVIIFIYKFGSHSLMALFRGEDYILFDPKIIPLFLMIPPMVIADVAFIAVLCPLKNKHKKAIGRIFQKIMIPTSIYFLSAFFIGFILSFIVTIYPLSSDYYKCKSTSIVSSGSHYAKSKEICRQRAYSPAPPSRSNVSVFNHHHAAS